MSRREIELVLSCVAAVECGVGGRQLVKLRLRPGRGSWREKEETNSLPFANELFTRLARIALYDSGYYLDLTGDAARATLTHSIFVVSSYDTPFLRSPSFAFRSLVQPDRGRI